MNGLLLKSINTNTLLIVLGIVAALAVIFAILIVLISKACAVEPNEKAEKIQESLAGANCGGCGFAGCADFAKALSEGKADMSSCGATSKENKAEIAKILGIPYSAEEEKVAIVHCGGGKNAKDKYDYVGNKGCDFKIACLGGDKICPEGCLGDGTCELACKFNSMKVKDGVAKCDKKTCSACGLCVKACPKKLIELVPKSVKVYVACSTSCRGKDVLNACSVGCIGCGICAKNCPTKAITLENNLPKIDYSLCSGCLNCVVKCPRKAIKELK